MPGMQRVMRLSCVGGALSLCAVTAFAQRAVIEHIEPTSGPVGTTVHVVGRGLGAATAARLGSSALRMLEVSPSRIRVTVPEAAQTGEITVDTPGGLIRGPEFRVTPPLPAPQIESFEPRSGAPGSHVVIRGRNFAPRLTGNAVTLGGQPVVVYEATPVELDVIVPDIRQGGPFHLRVQSAGEATSGDSFEVTTKTAITVVEPRRAAPGSQITITGTGFSPRASDNRVYLNNVSLEVVGASVTDLVVKLPAKIATGDLLVDVKGAGRATSPLPFVVQWPPTVVGFAPTSGAPGVRVTVRGTNFGDEPEAIEARLGEVRLPVREVHRTFLVLEIPEGASTDTLSIRVHGVGPAWSAIPFHVVATLSITGFAPRSGPAGTVVSIDGHGFDAVAEHNRVTIGGRTAEVIESSESTIKVRAAAGPSGPIEIQVPGGMQARSRDPFIVTEPPRVDSAEPHAAVIGHDITIHGRRFGRNTRLVQVTLGGGLLDVRSVRDDLLVARVTEGAATGVLRVEVTLQGADDLDREMPVLAALKVSSIHPSRGRVGDAVTVRGAGFLPEGTRVEFGGVGAPPDRVEPGLLQVTVPVGARTGIVVVRLSDGRTAAGPKPFAVTHGG